jgi:hypothetical protein
MKMEPSGESSRTKIDLKKEFKHLYSPPSDQIILVTVPGMNYLKVDGMGNPNTTPAFQQAIETLFTVSYTLKFMIKKAKAIDYVVTPLEGLWWVDDMNSFSVENKDEWKWTLMIMQPEEVTPAFVQEAIQQLAGKKPLISFSDVRFEPCMEGLSAQTLHIGPYCDEGPTIAGLHRFIHENGYKLRGKHHEIYLSDPRRTKPEKLRTILRQPVE